jgi:Fur family ferric uptake transcriptional regulator
MPRGARRGPGWWHGKFRDCGYRMTGPRQAILEVLHARDDHPSAEDIYLQVVQNHPNIGLTTVYRTLELLVQMGMVSKFDFGDKRSRYELEEGPEEKRHHHHLVCTSCHRVIDYTDFIDAELEFLRLTETGLSKKFAFKITNHMVRFYGLCDKCS